MTRMATLAAGLIIGLGFSASSLGAQVITGPEVSRKAPSIPPEVLLDSLGAGVDWMSLSEDEAVARLVYDPIKLLGLGSLGPEGTLTMKGVVREAEVRVRSTVRALSPGEVAPAIATRSMDEALAEFRMALRDLLEAR